jgi:hypothetical protein
MLSRAFSEHRNNCTHTKAAWENGLINIYWIKHDMETILETYPTSYFGIGFTAYASQKLMHGVSYQVVLST